MIGLERSDESGGNPSRAWYAADVLCVVLLFAYITLIHAGYLVWYVGGLRNRPPFMFDPYICYLVLATPVAAGCLIALSIRLVVSWPTHIHDSRRLLKPRHSTKAPHTVCRWALEPMSGM